MGKNEWPNYAKTRYRELGLANLDVGLWRFVYISDKNQLRSPPVVGPHYKSKIEALADLERYYQASWAST